MKRRLSVAMALIGDAKIIILGKLIGFWTTFFSSYFKLIFFVILKDEPTSGLVY